MKELLCPVCESPETRPAFAATDRFLRTTSKSFQLYRCRSCNVVFIFPTPSVDELRGFYPTGYWWAEDAPSGQPRLQTRKRLEDHYRRFVLQDHLRFILRAVGRLRRESQEIDVLDIGCSGGTLLHELSLRGISVCGLDVSGEAVAHAREAYQLDCEVGDLEHFPWKGRRFSIITLFHVLEHVANPGAFLKLVREHLRPGGVLIVQVPNLRSWQFHLFGRRWHGLDIPRHLVNFPEPALKDLLRRSGFQINLQKRFSLRDDAAACVSSVFPGLDPMGRAVRGRMRTGREKPSELTSVCLECVYFLLLLPAVVLALCDSLAGRGATIMIEAQSL